MRARQNDQTDKHCGDLARLRSHSRIIVGEAIACDDIGMPSFAIGSTTPSAFLYALDLIDLSGDDLGREPLQVRKATLASVLAKAASGLRFQPAGETRLVRGVPPCSPPPARWA